MITVSIKEAAELRGCTDRHLRQQALTGQINAIIEQTKTGRKKYMILLTELTEAEQIRYYSNHSADLSKELRKSKSKPKQTRSTDLESYSADQREEITMWSDILQGLDDYCIGKPSKTQAVKDYAAIAAEKYPDLKISADVLYRKKRALKEYGVCGLIDLRGGHNKGSSVIPEIAWQTFLFFYLDENKPPISKCIENTEHELERISPDLLPLPSTSTFYRHIQTDVKETIKILGREGEKAFTDRYTPYIRRVYDNMLSNDYWVADTHTLDIISSDDQTLHRLYLVAFMDARSGIIVGWHITQQPGSQATLIALRKAIMKHGIPRNIYVDNGREFLTKDVGGLGHRQKKKMKDEFTPPPIFERLGIKMTNAIVRNAKAKIIERRFNDLKNGISRLFDTFTGGTILERPEKLKHVLKGKQGTIPTDRELIEIIDELIEGYFNYEAYNGSVQKDKGKLKIQVYEDNLKTKCIASESDLNLMLMRSSRKYKVGQRGVHLTVAGEQIDYWNNEFVDKYIGKEVYFRYDPDNLGSIRVYDLEDRFIMSVPADNEAVLEYGASQDDIKRAVGKTRSHGKEVRKQLKELKNLYGGKSALEIMLEKAHSNKNLRIVSGSPIIEIKQSDDKEKTLKAVGAENDNIVSFERMIHNAETFNEY